MESPHSKKTSVLEMKQIENELDELIDYENKKEKIEEEKKEKEKMEVEEEVDIKT